MEASFKKKSFKFVFWTMLFFLTVDAIDTAYRFIVIGYLGEGVSFPGIDFPIKPDNVDLFVFLVVQVGIAVGIYMLYCLKKIGGYYFLCANVVFLIYASLFGPIADIGISNIFLPIFLYFFLYVFFAILVPFFYSEMFD